MRASLLPALVLAACGDYAAVLHVTFKGEKPPEGGGYRIEVRRANGAAVKGVDVEFVEVKDGKQDVALVFEDDGFLSGTDTMQLRVYAEAADSERGAALAIGTEVVKARAGEVNEVEVTLLEPPEATSIVTVELEPDGDVLVNATPGLVARAGHRLDLWTEQNGGIFRIGALDEDTETTIEAEGRRMGQLFIVEERSSSTSDLVQPNGWELYRSQLAVTAAKALGPVLDVGGDLDGMMALVAVAEAHAQLAVDATTNSSALLHVEHTFNCMAGRSRAGDDAIGGAPGNDGDLNQNGSFQFPSSDQEGLGSEEPGDPRGYLGAIEAAIEAAREDPEFTFDTAALDAMGCIGGLRAGLADLFAAAHFSAITAGDPENDDPLAANTQELVEVMSEIRGVDVSETTTCLFDRLYTMNTMTLEPSLP